MQIYTAEIVPKGWTNFHCHNGMTFFIALHGIFEPHFEDGILVRAKAGDVYFVPFVPSRTLCALVPRRRPHWGAGK